MALIRVQSSPPSSDRKTPPLLLRKSLSVPEPPSKLCTTAITIFGLLALTARPMRPVCAGKPPLNFFQVAPPLMLLKIPPTSSPPVAFGPDVKLQGVRCLPSSVAQTVSGFHVSSITSPHPLPPLSPPPASPL